MLESMLSKKTLIQVGYAFDIVDSFNLKSKEYNQAKQRWTEEGLQILKYLNELRLGNIIWKRKKAQRSESDCTSSDTDDNNSDNNIDNDIGNLSNYIDNNLDNNLDSNIVNISNNIDNNIDRSSDNDIDRKIDHTIVNNNDNFNKITLNHRDSCYNEDCDITQNHTMDQTEFRKIKLRIILIT